MSANATIALARTSAKAEARKEILKAIAGALKPTTLAAVISDLDEDCYVNDVNDVNNAALVQEAQMAFGLQLDTLIGSEAAAKLVDE